MSAEPRTKPSSPTDAHAPDADIADAQAHSVAIVGAGPRGLSVLERLVALATERFAGGQRDAAPTIVIHVIDPYPPGAGIVWRTDQPETLLMNTTIAEQTILPDSSCTFLAPGAAPTGPDMAQWYQAEGGSAPVDATFASRTLYGRYLRDAYTRIRDTAPDFITIVEHPTTVESVIDLPPLELLGHTPTAPDAMPLQLVR